MNKLIKKHDFTEVHQDSESMSEKPNLNGDRLNFFLLIILYVIQGFPIGLTYILPIILQSKQMMTYKDQVS